MKNIYVKAILISTFVLSSIPLAYVVSYAVVYQGLDGDGLLKNISSIWSPAGDDNLGAHLMLFLFSFPFFATIFFVISFIAVRHKREKIST